MSSGEPMDKAWLHATNFPHSRQDASGGAFLLQLVRGNDASLESGGTDSFSQSCSTKEMGATLLRQLRGEQGPGNSSKGMATCGLGCEAGDEVAERGKASLVQLVGPNIGKGVKENGPLAAESRKKMNSTRKTKATYDLHAKKHTAMVETKRAFAAQEWAAGYGKRAGRAHTRTKIWANAAAPRAGTERDGLGDGSFGGSKRFQYAVAGSWVDEWKLAADTQNSWGKMGGERTTSWWYGAKAPPTAQSHLWCTK